MDHPHVPSLVVLGVGLASSPGCGELVGADYRGEVLLQLTGQVLSDGTEPFGDEVGITLLWSLQLDDTAQQQSVVTQTAFPSRYTLQLYHPPRASELLPLMGQQWLPAAVGQPILFEDSDRDGLWDQSRERLVGGAFDRAIVWIEAIGERPEGVGGWVPDQTGFHVVEVLRQPCVDQASEEIGLLPTEARTDLEIGYYHQASFDWDCDGEGDWDPDGTHPDPLGDCAEPENYEQECEQYALVLDDPGLAGAYLELLRADPVLEHCLDEICPDVVDALEAAADCPDEGFLEETCGRYEQGIGQPDGAAYLDELAQDRDLESCLWQACPGVLSALYAQEPDPNDPGETCPDPQELDEQCRRIEVEAEDPVQGPYWYWTVLNDPELQTCLRGACDAVIDHLLGRPWE